MVNEEKFTQINPDELEGAAKELYKSMQADYTRKMQAISQTQKDSESIKSRLSEMEQAIAQKDSQLTQLMGSLEKFKKTNEDWVGWYNQNFDPETKEYLGERGNRGNGRKGMEYAGLEDLEALEEIEKNVGKKGVRDMEAIKKLSEMEVKLNAYKEAAEQANSKLAKSFNYLLQIQALRDKYGKENVNDQLVLETALERGLESLETAYEISHKDKIIDAEVNRKVAEKLEEERAKSTKVLKGEGFFSPTFYKTPEGVPSTFEEAKNLALQDIQSNELNPPPKN